MDLGELAQRIWAVSNDLVVQPLSKLLLDYWGQDDRTGLYVLLALAAGFVIGRFRASRALRAFSFQNRGEALLSDVVLRNLGPPDYHLMNHVTLQLEDGTTQIDHILVSRFGVFVIETKDYSGWIFGNGKQTSWTQVLFRSKFKFQNPIDQNMRHVRAVQGLLDFLPPESRQVGCRFRWRCRVQDGDSSGGVPCLRLYRLPSRTDRRSHVRQSIAVLRWQDRDCAPCH